ncbi:protein of unknown function [Denitratisoma oestradiolicum]|uniref:Uncharacterized protein n=1 Tax=Denitratisoma oestradiolicum TaxID=311182 RepID=A0A6S6YDP5_9PROT|nr:protein of unknown function [Denitratisoma oestradiolicum]
MPWRNFSRCQGKGLSPLPGNNYVTEQGGLLSPTGANCCVLGGLSQIRTVDLRIKSPLLYQLS